MRLKNKRTGEIGYLVVGKGCDRYTVTNDEWDNCGKYNSLAEVTEEWEDYEETKGINEIDVVLDAISVVLDAISEYCEEHSYYSGDLEKIKILNIVEDKLKAFKRLKDARFEFGTIKYNLDEESSSTIAYDGIITIKGMAYEDFVDDLDLLFGGEE